ncbi:MAG: beta-ketoacyl-ACP synthase II [Miltoncostaeaceae bacterium]
MVTGLGIVSSVGTGVDEVWSSVIEGRSGAAPIEQFDTSELATTIACQVKDFQAKDFIEHREASRMGRFAQLGVAAARMALEDARLHVDGGLRDRAGAIMGTAIGGIEAYEQQGRVLAEHGPARLSPLFIPQMMANMGAAQISMQLGLRGPLSCLSTACAAGNHALGDATACIRRGDADVMLAGGTEAAVTRLGIAAFNAMRALSTRNDDPTAASRPFDAARDGFVMGEAAAILVLERLDRAEARGAEPYCEVLGYGATGDSHHLTDPDPTGAAPAAAIAMALGDAGLAPEDVGYVNAHATATTTGDPNEVVVLRRALGNEIAARTPVSATKSMHGHCLGAAGGVEGVLTALAVKNDMAPPTINLDDIDLGCEGVDHVRGTARATPVDAAISNSFGIGGHNAVIVMGRVGDR